jgi:hypothetical protein
MMQRFFKLETVIRRAPLGMRFLDLVRGVSVTDGLVVSAWQIGTSGPRQVAFTSPMSGVYGFRTLPGFRPFEVGERPASDWCASPPDVGEPTADELTSLDALQGLLRAEESPPAGANFIVFVEDGQGRFLPQVMLMCLPKERLVEVPLLSSPARLAPAGLGVVHGELAVQGSQPLKPASWALVAASLDSHTYVGVADARGMFILFVPYASALPPLEGSPPHGSGNIDLLTWPLTISVFYQPSRQQFVPDLEPPDTLSILEQGRATVYDRVGVPGSNLVRSIRFGADLVVATVGQSQLLVDPAPP